MQETHEMTILVVEDDVVCRMMVNRILERHYQSIIIVESAEQAWDVVRQAPPDLILLDINLPGMDGYEFCRQLRGQKVWRNIPVIFMTASQERESIKLSFEAGGSDYISKPINNLEVRARVQAALTLKQTQEQVQKELLMRRQAEADLREQYGLLEKAHTELESLYEQLQMGYELAGVIFSRIARQEFEDCPHVRYLLSPMEKVGGDFLLFAPTPAGGLHLILGDFTGHGLAAALGAIPVADIFYSMTSKGFPLNNIISEINQQLKAKLPTGRFLCACLIELNSSFDTATVWNGGLPDALVIGEPGIIKQRLESRYLPLGIVNNDALDNNGQIILLSPGDRLYVYSDGVSETTSPEGELFGQERLEELLAAAPDKDGLLEAVAGSLASFRAGTQQQDDIIIAQIRYNAELGTTGPSKRKP